MRTPSLRSRGCGGRKTRVPLPDKTRYLCSTDDPRRNTLMKLPAALALTLLIAAAQIVQAQSASENPYDIFGRTLAPFVNLFAKNATSPNRAMSADLRLAEAGGKAAKLP